MGVLFLLLDTALPVVALIAALALHKKGRSNATLGMLAGAGIMTAGVVIRMIAMAIGMAVVPEFGTPGWNAFEFAVGNSHIPAIAGETVFLVSLLHFALRRTDARLETAA